MNDPQLFTLDIEEAEILIHKLDGLIRELVGLRMKNMIVQLHCDNVVRSARTNRAQLALDVQCLRAEADRQVLQAVADAALGAGVITIGWNARPMFTLGQNDLGPNLASAQQALDQAIADHSKSGR